MNLILLIYLFILSLEYLIIKLRLKYRCEFNKTESNN